MRYFYLMLALAIIGCSTTTPTGPATDSEETDPMLLFYGYVWYEAQPDSPGITFCDGAYVEFKCYTCNWMGTTTANEDGYYEVYGPASHAGHQGYGLADSLNEEYFVTVNFIDPFGEPPENVNFEIVKKP